MKKHTLTTLILSALSIISFLITSVSVYAVSDEDYSLTVEFVANDHAISGSEVRVYRAMDNNGSLYGDFAGYNVEIGDLNDSEALGELADTLYSFVLSDNLTADYSGTTNSVGTASFDVPQEGIYLISGTSVKVDDVLYTPKPTLVWIPYVSDFGELVTDVVVELKYDRRTIVESETVERSVIKVWDDNDSTLRPSEITVQLFRNGDIFDTVTLTAQSDWQYTWTALDPEYDWQIAEVDVPEDYRVSISLDKTAFIVRNKLDTTTQENTSTSTAATTSNNNTTVTTTVQTETSLPQTGQLWWPVPIMLIVGLVLFLAGVIICNTNYEKKS